MAKMAFLFPGQGAQYVGMGKELAAQYPEARAVFAEADEALGMPLSRLCFEGPEEELHLTVNTQPAVVVTSLACLAVFQKKLGERAAAVAGLSLGEYSALVAAGSLSCGTAVTLVRKRGEYMQEVVPPGKGAMTAIIGLDREEVIRLCREAAAYGVVAPANFNCPGQVVISGEKNAVAKARDMARKAGARRVIDLPVSAPFHSPLLKPAGEKMARELEQAPLEDARLPLVANVSAAYLTRKEEIKGALVKQVSEPVLWEETLRRLARDGVEIFVEIGPGRALSGFVRKTVPGATTLNVDDPTSLARALDQLEEVV